MDNPPIELPFQLRNETYGLTIRPTPARRIVNLQLPGGLKSVLTDTV